MRLILAYNTSFSYWGSSKFGSRKISKFRIALPIEHPFYNRYPIHMFLFNTCQKPDCQLYAAHGEDYCLHHVDNPEACNTRLVEIIHDTKVLKDLNSSCINVEDSDFSDHTFMVCNFSESSFKNVDFSHSSFDLCFLQYSRFENCRFAETNIKYSVFAGSTFINCDFKDSDIVHTNFLGIHAENCVFNDSDLYYSNFTSAELRDVSFVDCNLKKADFVNSSRETVSFKYSNYEEARFQQDTAI